MLNKIADIAGNFGAFKAIKWLTRSSPVILMYHRFGEEKNIHGLERTIFEQQMLLIKQQFNVLALEQLTTRLINNQPVEPNTIVITVDDGYEDFYLYAFPILKKLELPVTLYATYDFIEGKIWLWPDLIRYILCSTKYKNFSLTLDSSEVRFKLNGKQNRNIVWNDIADYCLALSNIEKLDFIENIAQDLKVQVPDSPVEEYRALNWNQIQEMIKYNVKIEGHTFSHPKLTKLTEDELKREIIDSKEALENKLGVPVNSFAYPNGTRDDFNEIVKSMVKTAGYTNATVGYHDGDLTGDLYELGRYAVGDNMQQFRKTLHGVEYLSVMMRSR